MRCLLAGAWQPPAASTFSLHVDASVPSPRCRWPPQHRLKKPPARTTGSTTAAVTGVRWLSYSALALEPSQAAPVPEATAAGRRRNRSGVPSSTNSLKSPRRRGGRLRASSTPASEHELTEIDRVDLAALLEVLGLAGRELEMSKRNPALLGLGLGRRGLTEAGIEAVHDRVKLDLIGGSSTGGISSAPWVMLEDVGMTPVEVAAVVTAYPLLLTAPAKQARMVVRWLADRAGFSSKQMVNVIKSHPGILHLDVEARLEPHVEWLEEEGLSKASIAMVLSEHPKTLGRDIESTLSPKILWLKSYLGLSTDGVARVLKACPQVLGLPAKNLEWKVAWLERHLDSDRQVVSKIVKRDPWLFRGSIYSMEPKMVWLKESLGLEGPGIAAVVHSCPGTLALSVEENLQPTMEWLQNRMHLDQKSLAAMVRGCPRILGLSAERNIEPKLTWLKENLDLDEELVIRLVKILPSVFGYSAEFNLGPTLDFFREELGGSREEIREAVISNPKMLSFSLKKRMIPRVAMIEEAGLGPPMFRDHVNPITVYTKLAFDKWLDKLLLIRGMPPRQKSTTEAGAGGGDCGGPETPAAAATSVAGETETTRPTTVEHKRMQDRLEETDRDHVQNLPERSTKPEAKHKANRNTMTGVRGLSYPTVALETSQAAPVPAATADRPRNRNAVTSSKDHEQTEIPFDEVEDLAALLDVLRLTEKDVLPEMSKRHQARLGLGQERRELAGPGGEAAYGR